MARAEPDNVELFERYRAAVPTAPDASDPHITLVARRATEAGVTIGLLIDGGEGVAWADDELPDFYPSSATGAELRPARRRLKDDGLSARRARAVAPQFRITDRASGSSRLSTGRCRRHSIPLGSARSDSIARYGGAWRIARRRSQCCQATKRGHAAGRLSADGHARRAHPQPHAVCPSRHFPQGARLRLPGGGGPGHHQAAGTRCFRPAS